MTIAAFFDLDGTVLAAPSLERRYLRYLNWRGDLNLGNWLRAAVRMVPLAVRANWSWETRDAGEAEWAVMAANNKAYLAGVPCWTLDTFCAWLRRYPIPLLPDALRRIGWHLEQGHAVVFVTGAPEPLARTIAQEIHPGIEVLATQLESSGDCWTGNVVNRAMAGIEKSRAVARLAAARRWHLQLCFAYGDSWADRWLLARVGHAIAVNPCRKLEKRARQERWPVTRWPQAPPAANRILPLEAQRNDFVERLRQSAKQQGYALSFLSKHPTQALEETHGLHSIRAVEEPQSKTAIG